MPESLLTRDLRVKAPKSVRTVLFTGVFVGLIFIAVGVLFTVSPPRTDGAQRLGFLLGGLVGLGLLGVSGGVMVKFRIRTGLLFSWLFAIGAGLLSGIVVVLSISMNGGLRQAIGPGSIFLLTIGMVAALISSDTTDYVRGRNRSLVE